jgi:hypothetical protein
VVSVSAQKKAKWQSLKEFSLRFSTVKVKPFTVKVLPLLLIDAKSLIVFIGNALSMSNDNKGFAH